MSSEEPTSSPYPKELVELAWHAVVFDEDDKPKCSTCFSPGDDACPVMRIVLNTECPFPDIDDLELLACDPDPSNEDPDDLEPDPPSTT